MASVVYLTTEPVRVTAATVQSLRLALDVSAFDELDLILTVYEGTSVVCKIVTAMQNEDDVQGWLNANGASPFGSVSAGASGKANFQNFLKYVRWEVTSSGNATFMISGIGRRWA